MTRSSGSANHPGFLSSSNGKGELEFLVIEVEAACPECIHELNNLRMIATYSVTHREWAEKCLRALLARTKLGQPVTLQRLIQEIPAPAIEY